jgi:hypothetical protein
MLKTVQLVESRYVIREFKLTFILKDNSSRLTPVKFIVLSLQRQRLSLSVGLDGVDSA